MIPYFTLNNGMSVPVQGLGTFTLKGDIMTGSIKAAFKAGCNLIDTASAYMNEQYIGKSICQLERQGILKRSDLIIQSKVGDKITPQGKPIGYFFYNSPSCPNHDTRSVVFKQVESSLKKLKTDYLDIVLIHWPYYDVLNDIWSALEHLYEQGVIKGIGVSNCRKRHIERIMRTANIIPMINQTNISPINTQSDEIDFYKKNNIILEAYSPLSTARNVTFLDNQKELIKFLTEKYNKSIQQILLRWFFQKGIITIPRTKRPERVFENCDIYNFQLSDDEIFRIDASDFGFQSLVESLYCPGY